MTHPAPSKSPLREALELLRTGAAQVLGLEQRTSLFPPNSNDEPGWGPLRTMTPIVYATTGRNARILGFESHPTVHECARVIAEGMAAVPIEAYRKQQDGSPLVLGIDAPANLLMLRPRVNMNGYKLISLSAVHWLIYGNVFWVLERRTPSSSPYAIRLVHPEDIVLVVLDAVTLEPVGFEWRDRRGLLHQSFATDVVHFADLAGGDWLFGYPRAATALLEMASEREASEYVRQILVNDGAPGHVALGADGTSSNDAKLAEGRWRARMVERGYRGSTVFLTGVRDFKALGFNLNDLEFPALRSLSRESICSAFNVDPRLVGATSAKGNEGGLSQAGYEEARRRLYSQAIIPTMRAFEATLDAELGVEWGHTFFRFSPERLALLTETATERADRTGKMLSAGGITREEYRKANFMPEKMVPTDTLVGTLGRIEYPVAAGSGLGRGDGVSDPDADELPDALPAGDKPKALPPGSPPAAAAAAPGGVEVVQDTALNGAQIAQLLEIVAKLSNGEIPVGSAEGILAASFPTLTPEQISRILAGVEGYNEAKQAEKDAAASALAGAAAAAAGGTPPAKPPAPAEPEPKRNASAPYVRDGHGGRVLKRGVVLSAQAKQDAWGRADAKAVQLEPPYRRAALTLFEAERIDIVTGLKSNGDTVPVGKSRALISREDEDPYIAEAMRRARKNYRPGGAYHKRWVDRYTNLIGETIRTAGGDLAAEVGLSFNVSNPAVLEAITGRAQFLAAKVCDYSSETIVAVLRTAREQGMGSREAANLLSATLEGMEPARAIRIARTETIGALNEGEQVSAAQTGVLKTHEWLGLNDGNERPSHGPAPEGVSGEVRPIEERFSNGLLHPGDHAGDADEVINCRCTQLFYD